jgi:signal transduction histidine kinase
MADLVMFPANASNLVYAAVILVLVAYVARLPDKSIASKIAFGVLLFAGFFNLWTPFLDFYFNSGWSSWWFTSGTGPFIVGFAMMLAFIAMVTFAYLLGPQRFSREQRWVLGAMVVLGLVFQLSLAVGRPIEFLPPLLILASIIASTSVLVRKWWRAPTVEQPGVFNRAAYAGYGGFGVLVLLSIPLSLLLGQLGFPEAAEIISESWTVISWVGVGLLFLQYAPEPTSLEAKFVLAACLGVLVITTASTAPINRPGERLPLYMPIPAPQTLAFVPLSAGGYRAEGRRTAFFAPDGDTLDIANNAFAPVAAGFPMSIFGQNFDSLFVWEDGLVSFGPRPSFTDGERWKDFYLQEGPSIAVLGYDMSVGDGGAVIVDRTADRLTVTWSQVPSWDRNLGTPADRAMNAQLVIQRDGTVQTTLGEMAFRPWQWRRGLSAGSLPASVLPDLGAFGKADDHGQLVATHLPMETSSSGLLFREERNRRQYELWATATSMAILKRGIGALVLILVLVPLFFRSGVRRRLRALRSGLQRVDGGDMDVEVPVTINDEIGQISTSFNGMTTKLRRYNTEMETLVEERTAELKATQAQLIEQEKLASLGALTAGIAHEIKNPLNFVNNFAEVNAELSGEVREALDAGDLSAAKAALEDLESNSEQIAKHGRRADDIVRSMMQHARGGVSERERVSVNAFVEEYVGLAWHGARARDHGFQAEMVREYGADAGTASVFPQELGRVLLNLLGNAFDAVRDTADATVTVTTACADGLVEITVTDNGPGVPEEIRSRIFEPFFTTKATGEGTGLGLSLSYDIVTKGHGGTMSVESGPGGGALFRISLPA